MADTSALVQQLLQRATTPLVPQISSGWRMLADLVDNPNSGSSNVPLARLKGLLAGGLTGLGDTAAGMTSPVGVASLAAGGTGAAMRPAAANARLASRAAEMTKLPAPDLSQVPREFWPVGSEGPSKWDMIAELLKRTGGKP